jgi:ATP-binding cassette subfamily C protein LapB
LIDLQFAPLVIFVIVLSAWQLVLPVLLAIVAVVIYAYVLRHKMHELSETTCPALALRTTTLTRSLTGSTVAVNSKNGRFSQATLCTC